MGISIKTLEKYKMIYDKLLTYPEEELPTWIGNLAKFAGTDTRQVKNVLDQYNVALKFLGTEEQIKELRRQHQSEVARIREASYSPEFKEKRRQMLSEKGKKQYENLSEEQKLNYRNNTFHKNWTPEKESLRRAKIKQAENSRSNEEIMRIANKRKATFETKSTEELNDMYRRQGESLKNTLSKLTEEERVARNKKTGEGRKLAYKKESPEHREATKNKAKETCLKNHGVPWYVLSPKMKSTGRMYSKINQDIAKRLSELNITFVSEFSLAAYSYDFKIGKYLIEINPSATHNVDWIPFSDGHSKILKEDYHKNKTETALNNGYICLQIFDWMKIEDYLADILTNSLYLEKLKNLDVYYYDLDSNKLVSSEEYKNCINKRVVKIIGDGYKICKCVK